MDKKTKNIAINEDTHAILKSIAARIKKPLGEAATEGAELWIKQHRGTDTRGEEQKDKDQ